MCVPLGTYSLTSKWKGIFLCQCWVWLMKLWQPPQLLLGCKQSGESETDKLWWQSGQWLKHKVRKINLLIRVWFRVTRTQDQDKICFLAMHSGSLVRFGDFCISLLGNHVLACTSLWGCKVGNIFAKIYSFMTNGSDPLKIWVSFHLLTFAHLGWCLWCEGEGLSHCVPVMTPDKFSYIW